MYFAFKIHFVSFLFSFFSSYYYLEFFGGVFLFFLLLGCCFLGLFFFWEGGRGFVEERESGWFFTPGVYLNVVPCF